MLHIALLATQVILTEPDSINVLDLKNKMECHETAVFVHNQISPSLQLDVLVDDSTTSENGNQHVLYIFPSSMQDFDIGWKINVANYGVDDHEGMSIFYENLGVPMFKWEKNIDPDIKADSIMVVNTDGRIESDSLIGYIIFENLTDTSITLHMNFKMYDKRRNKMMLHYYKGTRIFSLYKSPPPPKPQMVNELPDSLYPPGTVKFNWYDTIFANGAKRILYPYYYKDDMAKLQPLDNDSILTLISLLIAQNPGYEVEIQFHEIITSNPNYGTRLTQRRAEYITRCLEEKYKIYSTYYKTNGYGGKQPLFSKEDRQLNFFNSRMEVIIHKRKSSGKQRKK